MKDYIKKNLLFLAAIFAAALIVFSTVMMLDGGPWWSAILPCVAISYGIFSLVRSLKK